ncbi:MAG: putative glycoside hydrolase [bacterium]
MFCHNKLKVETIKDCCLHFCTILLFYVLSSTQALAQLNHPYPRTGVQHFGNAPAQWYARFDLVIVPWQNEKKVLDIKARNPNCRVLWTDGWTSFNSKNPVQAYIPNEAPEWFTKGSDGKDIELNWGKLMNMSSLCPKVNGKRYVDRHPEVLVQQVDLNVYDGIASDWCWGKPHGISDIDLDRNGVNDYNEHGEQWVSDRWLEGVLACIQKLRDLIGPDKLIWINAGQFQDWGWDNSNGVELERFAGILNWNFVWKRYNQFMAQARQPHILLMDNRPWGGDNNLVEPTRNYLRLARFMLTVTMLGDGYYNFNPLEADEHHFHAYYDEFDLNVGFPTSAAAELSNGCFVRFFDAGAVITNPTGSSQNVSDADLRSLAGYSGPYFRFKGSQDPDFNNGKMFTNVELVGSKQPKGNTDLVVGDGIILVKQPQTIVSDIIIDNLDYGTSPMQEPATFIGNWEQTRDGRDHYSYDVRPSKNRYPHAFTTGGSGNETATFDPNISVAGDYEVFEWHGYVDASQMAGSVPYTIYFGNGNKKTKIVNQSTDQGRWNSLGVYNFPVGRSGKVVISNEATGLVVADAIMFVYHGSEGVADMQAPAAPTGLKVEQN